MILVSKENVQVTIHSPDAAAMKSVDLRIEFESERDRQSTTPSVEIQVNEELHREEFQFFAAELDQVIAAVRPSSDVARLLDGFAAILRRAGSDPIALAAIQMHIGRYVERGFGERKDEP